MKAVTDVFPRVRDVIQKVMYVPRDEITLETHVYNDLGMDSVDITELFIGLEEVFDLKVSTRYFSKLISESWEAYKIRANDMMFEHFVVLGFSRSASKRVGEMKKLCKKYHVQPFSVGFLCAWIAQMLHEKG